MKIRSGFVSNSSSSSFVCEICGETASGWDASYADAGMAMCELEHVFCEEHLITDEEQIENDDYGSVYPSTACPICQFQEPSYPDIMKCLLKTSGVKEKDVFDEIKKVNKRRQKLRPHEYVEYCLRQMNTTVDKYSADMKAIHGTYANFRKGKKVKNEN